jgi:hypothetical protein
LRSPVRLHAVQACSGLRRPKDRWGILKIGPKQIASRFGDLTADGVPRYRQKWVGMHVDSEPGAPSNVPQQQDYLGFDYSSGQICIDTMLDESPICLNESASGSSIAGSALSSLLRVDFGTVNPHLIFLADSSKTQLIPAMSAKGAALGATVHVLAQSAAWDTEKVRQLVAATGGMHRSVSDNDTCLKCAPTLTHPCSTTTGLAGGKAAGISNWTFTRKRKSLRKLCSGIVPTHSGAPYRLGRRLVEAQPASWLKAARTARRSRVRCRRG